MGNIVSYKNHVLLGLYMMNDIAPIMGILVLLCFDYITCTSFIGGEGIRILRNVWY